MDITSPAVIAASEMLPLLISSIVAYVLFQTIATHIIFKKIGVMPFHAWIPVWSSVMFVKASGLNLLFLLLWLVPLGSTIVFIISAHKIGEQMGFKGAKLTVLAALVPPLWFFIAAGARKVTPRDVRLGLA